MKVVILIVYVVMAAWLLFASAARIALQLNRGLDLDVLPFLSGALGLLALLLLLPAFDEWRQRR